MGRGVCHGTRRRRSKPMVVRTGKGATFVRPSGATSERDTRGKGQRDGDGGGDLGSGTTIIITIMMMMMMVLTNTVQAMYPSVLLYA